MDRTEMQRLLVRLVEESSARAADGPLTWEDVGAIVDDHEIVYAVWLSDDDQIHVRNIKGRALERQNANAPVVDGRMAAVPCHDEEQAEALRRSFGDETEH